MLDFITRIKGTKTTKALLGGLVALIAAYFNGDVTALQGALGAAIGAAIAFLRDSNAKIENRLDKIEPKS